MKIISASMFLVMLIFSYIPVAQADKGFSVADLKGNYSFSFEGQVIGVGPVAAVGAFLADGKGNILEAVRTISINGLSLTETFTCALTVNPDGTGSAICPLDIPAPGAPAVESFDFVLGNKGRTFRHVGTTPGVVVLGSGRRQ